MSPGFIYLACSVCLSVSVAVLLKVARIKGVDIRQAIAANYAVAIVLCVTLLNPSWAILKAPSTPWFTLIALGVLLPTVFLAMFNSVKHAGIIRSDAAQRLSLFIPLIAAFLFFGETFTLRKTVAIAVGLLALFCLLKRATPAVRLPASGHQSSGATVPPVQNAADAQGPSPWIWPLAVWFGYGICDVLFKQVARTGTAFGSTLTAAFTLALVLTLVYLFAKRIQWRAAYLATGILLGALNFGNIYTYIRAHQSLPNDPAIVFSAMNIGVIALGTLAGAAMFRERLSALNAVGLVLAVTAVLLMTPW